MKFSIVTISYNSAKTLATTIESVLSQQGVDLEYLLVDGASTDATLEIIKEYASKDARIRWVSEPDAGLSDAMNKGVLRASGDIVAHLHSDDYYPDNEILKKVESAFETDDNALWLTGGQRIIDASGATIEEIDVREFSYARLRKGNTIMHPATFLKREAFSRFGLFDTELKFAMDYDMWLRIGKEEQPLTVAAPLACFRAHEGSISTANQRKVYDEVWKIRKGRCGYGFFEQRWRFLVFLAKKIYYGVLFPRPYA